MRMTFGRYVPYNSIIHKIDPRIKLFTTIFLIVVIFLPIGFTGITVMFFLITLLYLLSKLKLRMLFKLLLPILFIFLILMIVNVFAFNIKKIEDPNWIQLGPDWLNMKLLKQDKNPGYIIKWGVMYFAEKGFYEAMYICLRIFLMIELTTILTGTTQPIVLTLAIEDLLSPLKLIKFPVYIFSTIISIALRMIPTLIDESGRIMKAQASRGTDFKNGKFKDKVKNITSLIIPLLVSSFQKAEDLAYAMDSRGYDTSGKRTRYRKLTIKFSDILFFILTVGIGCFVIVYANVLVLNQYQIPRVDKILGYFKNA